MLDSGILILNTPLTPTIIITSHGVAKMERLTRGLRGLSSPIPVIWPRLSGHFPSFPGKGIPSLREVALAPFSPQNLFLT